MPETLHILQGARVLVCSPDGKKLRSDRDAVELIGEAHEHEAGLIVIPAERFEGRFRESDCAVPICDKLQQEQSHSKHGFQFAATRLQIEVTISNPS